MLQQQNRLYIILSFTVGALFTIASLGACWSVFASQEKENLGAWPLIFTLLALGGISNLFRLAHKLSDKNALDEYVENKVADGRAALLDELKKKEEETNIEDTENVDLEENAKQIVPSGNFKNADSFGKKLLVNVANELNLVQGVFYIAGKKDEFSFSAGFALTEQEPAGFKLGENLNGEAAKNKVIMTIDEVPADYFNVESGLGKIQPGYIYLVPIVDNNKSIALIEFASFSKLSEQNILLLENVAKLTSTKINQIVKA